ncbi:MAG: hypothetical protein QXS53_02575 [Candidatus Anstonellales archaeon]
MYLAVLAIIILLAGCLDNQSNNQKPPVSNDRQGGIEIIRETERMDTNYVPTTNTSNNSVIDWGDVPEQKQRDVENYTFMPYDPLIITFFNVGFGEKQGRMVLIRRGTLDVYIWGVPEETYAKAYSFIKSYSDDIEYVIIPSARDLNFETYYRLKSDFQVGKTIAPENIRLYRNDTFDIYLKQGDILELAGFKIEVLQAGKDYLKSNPGDMSLVLKVSMNNTCMIFLLDIETGGLQRLNSDNVYRFRCDYFSWNAYGVYFLPDLYLNFFNYFGPKHMIADGSAFGLYDRGTRLGLYQRASAYNISVARVWENETVTIIFK